MTIVYTPPLFDPNAMPGCSLPDDWQLIRVEKAADFMLYPDADLFIDGAFDGHFCAVKGPVLFHCPALCFPQLEDAPPNSARFCAWPGFWERKLWELAPHPAAGVDFSQLLAPLGIQVKQVADIPGLIGPRILCTLINEAAYTLADGIANAGDIDTAMKLGTNYPRGPVEWAKQIGGKEVQQVLAAMATEKPSYAPHPILQSALFSGI